MAIKIFKNHFKADLASLDPDFPLSEWDRLISQDEIKLNLFTPPCTSILANSKPDVRASWAPTSEMD